MKRIFAVAVCMVMLFGTYTVRAGFSDVQGQHCEEAVSVLHALGIIQGTEENMFEPANGLSRAELTALVLRLMGNEVSAKGGDVFADVTPAHWAYDEITAAYQLGIIKGMDAQTFAPDADVSLAQAAKMVVCALGYTVAAEAMGGYPSGYLAKAAQLDLLKGVSTGEGAVFTRGDMAILLYNALHTNLMENTSFGSDAGAYVKETTKTPLTGYLGMQTYEGIVYANYYTDLRGSNAHVRKNEVVIGSTRLQIGDTSADAFLGMEVTAYVKSADDAASPVILALVQKKRSTSVQIPAEEISAKTTADTLVFEKEGKEYSESLSGAVLVLNGTVKQNWTAADICPVFGTVTCISNTGNGVDFLLVESFENFIVSSKNAGTHELFFTDGTSALLDTENGVTRASFTDAEGNSITVADCRSGDVISVARSPEVIRAIRSRKTVMGRVYEQNDTEIRIEETVYALDKKVSQSFLGVYADFLLDFKNRVAGADTESMIKGEYGVVLHTSQGKGLSGEVQFKLLTESGAVQVFDTADKVQLNDIGVSAAGLMQSTVLMQNGTPVRQLIRYTLNDAGEISKIETAADYIGRQEDESRYGVFSKDFYVDETIKVNGEPIYYQGGTVGVFAGKYKPADTTKIFVVPEKSSDEKKCRIYTRGQLLHSSEGGDDFQKNMAFYDVNEGNIIGAILILTDDEGVTSVPDYLDSMGVITSVSTVVEDGEPRTKIKLLNSQKKEIELLPEEDTSVYFSVSHTDVEKDPCVINGVRKDTIALTELCVGDVIQYSLDAGTGQLKRMNVIFRAKYRSAHEQSWRYYGANRINTSTSEFMNYGSGVMTALGDVRYVTQYGAKTVTKNLQNGKEYERFYSFAGCVMIWDTKKECIINQDATYEDIHVGDKILSVSAVQRQLYIIVYR